MKTDKNVSTSSIWKKILKIIFEERIILIKMILAVLLQTVLDVCTPLLNEYALKTFFNTDMSLNNFDNATWFSIFYLLFAISNGFTVFLFLYYADKLYVRCSYRLRNKAYDKIQQLSFSYFDTTPQGWLMARMTSDSRKLSNILSWVLVDFVWGLFTMIGILIVLYIVNVKLAIIVTLLIPIMFIIAIIIRKKILKSHRDAREINSQITALYNEGFMGMRASKTLVIEDSNEKEFNITTRKYRKASMRAVIFTGLFGPMMFLVGYIGVALTLSIGGNMVLLGLEISVLYLFIDYTIRFFDPIIMLSNSLAEFQQAQAAAERIVNLIETEPEIKDTKEVIGKYGTLYDLKKENWEDLKGDIEFKNVTFKYKEGEEVLKDFSLKIKAGTSVALVGHTGSGKSTIVNLICRFYEPTSGEILIDGKNYKERSVSWLHSNIGYVLQTPQLFSGTILDNIKYGKLDAMMDEVIEAAKIANCHDFIIKFEDGYNTDIGEGGNKLSLGQKQLISIARAIISNPKILILDEATSSVDTETEMMIQDATNNIMREKTTFAVAHRLSTIVNSDLILVLENGEIIESGNHKELLNKKGYYFELYKNQFKSNLLDKDIE